MVRIYGAPFDGGGARLGSRLGPAALKIAGLQPTLEGLGLSVDSWHDFPQVELGDPGKGLHHLADLMPLIVSLQAEVSTAFGQGCFPIVLGGEHSISMGSVSAALSHFGTDLAVLWIDAHADLNTPGRSPSGNIHGMPLAALAGLPSESTDAKDADWKSLQAGLSEQKLDLGKVAWLGLRDVDLGERQLLRDHPGCLPLTMFDVDRNGIVEMVSQFDAWMKTNGLTRLWISFDVDVLDPILAPGTGTAVRGGLTYREAHLLAELLRANLDSSACPYKLVGLDLVETNPLEDSHNMTAKMAVEWIASLFGKAILGVHL